MSERALAYSEEPLSHRFLVLYEAAGMSGAAYGEEGHRMGEWIRRAVFTSNVRDYSPLGPLFA
jgi:hypothetical protein